jgi:hypothetical protein
MSDENIVGNEQALAEEQVEQEFQNSSHEQKSNQVNPGAIRKSQTQSILNALSRASGTELSSVEDAVAMIAKMSAQKSGGNEQPVETQTRQSNRVTTNDLHEQFQKLRGELSQKEQALRAKELETDILQTMGDRFDPELSEYAIQKVKANISWNDDGTYSIVNSKGQERYGEDGNPLSLRGLVEEVAKGNPKLLKTKSSASGSGLRPGQTNFAGVELDQVPDYSKDPAAFKAWAQRRGLAKGSGLRSQAVSVASSPGSKRIY